MRCHVYFENSPDDYVKRHFKNRKQIQVNGENNMTVSRKRNMGFSFSLS